MPPMDERTYLYGDDHKSDNASPILFFQLNFFDWLKSNHDAGMRNFMVQRLILICCIFRLQEEAADLTDRLVAKPDRGWNGTFEDPP